MIGASIIERPGVRRVLIPVLCARYLRSGIRLVVNEIFRRQSIGRYYLRGTDFWVNLRHPYVDIWVFDEIFRRRSYAYPPEVAAAIGRLGRPANLVDLGACAGLATVFFMSRFDIAKSTMFEPDAANRAVLLRTVKDNGLADRCSVVAACAATADGTVPFISDHFLSRIDPSATAPEATPVAALDVFPYLQTADVLKVDIQGSEWSILSDPRFAGLDLKAVVIEYHPYLAPSVGARAGVVGLLEKAGYRVSPIVNDHDGEGTLWAWR